jgi:glycosyltransferase involved in cell wall biosynthesis
MKILQLTTYPTGVPRHGGQIRCASMATELRRAGHDVKAVAVYVEKDYAPDSEDDIPFNPTSDFWVEDLPFLSDYFSGLHAAQDSSAFAALEKLTDEFRPDVIISEHPWLMPAAERLAAARNGLKLVYSSHNVENRLKEAVIARTDVPPAQRTRLTTAIRTLEHEAAARADLVIACTETDAAYYNENVPGCSNIIIAGNGVEPFSCAPSRVQGWRSYVARPFPIFVSSAHPPNANGFWDMMAPGLTFLRPGERVLIAGSVCEIILQMKGFEEYEAVNISRLQLLGPMEKTELQAAVSASHVVLLPITEGEGSNLKTAEALESGCAIVGTTRAFRGFERAASLRHVHITDNPLIFRKTVRRILDAPRYQKGTPLEVRSEFHWSDLLRGAVANIGGLKDCIEQRVER